MPFQPVDTQRLYQQVADQIGELIRSKEFSAGHRLPAERDLAKLLGVSRPVVREAMIALEIAGLVEVRTGSGTYVKLPAGGGPITPVSLDDVGPSPFDIISARILVESEVAFTAATEASQADLDEIAELHRTMCQRARERLSLHETDRSFHERIALATHNTVLPAIVGGLWDSQFGAVFSVLSRRTRLPENQAATIDAHGRITEALGRRDGAAARLAMRDHLRQVMAVLMREDDEEEHAQ
jgi:DNA-binding FadR family transcriptional regulator